MDFGFWVGGGVRGELSMRTRGMGYDGGGESWLLCEIGGEAFTDIFCLFFFKWRIQEDALLIHNSLVKSEDMIGWIFVSRHSSTLYASCLSITYFHSKLIHLAHTFC